LSGIKKIGVVILLLFCLAGKVYAEQSVVIEEIAPLELISLMRHSLISAPSIKDFQRSLVVAESVYRMETAEIYGLQSDLIVPVEVINTGMGGGVQAQLKKQFGATSITLNARAVAGYQWSNNQYALAPVLEVSIKHLLIGASDGKFAIDQALDEAQHDFVTKRRSFELSLMQTYGQLIQAHHDLEIRELERELASLKRTTIESMQSGGAVSVLSQYEATKEVNLAENAYQRAVLKLEEARQEVIYLSGVETVDWPKEALVTPIIFTLPDLEELVVEGCQSRDDIQIAKQKVELAKYKLQEAKKGLGITGGINADIILGPELQNKWEWRIQAAFSLPLVNNAQKEKVIQAQLDLEEAQAALERLEAKAKLEITKAYNQVIISQKAYEIKLDEYHHVQLLYDVVAEGLEKGLYTQIELLQALLLVTQAENAVVEGRYDLFTQLVSFWYSIGRDVVW
jgi:hypothetical protein